ncbi:MAG: ATP-binding protein [Leptolyngbyaceae cyanobacterium bins.349]|nr:ATP-binding protein [Leptolyngbyaceae cyanobacterium bins.349]
MGEAIAAQSTLSPTSDWAMQNHRYLMTAIEQVFSYLEPEATPVMAPPPIQPMAAIERLCQLFRLSAFERAILLLCAGMELHHSFATLKLSTAATSVPTLGLALSRLPYGHWSAITAESPLRRWHLIALGDATTLTHCPLRINERILHFLLGDTQLDPQLVGIVTEVSSDALPQLPASQQQLVTEIVTLLQQASEPPLIQLTGSDSAMKRLITLVAATQSDCGVLSVSADALPTDSHQFQTMQTLWQREAILSRSMLLLDCDCISNSSQESNLAVTQLNAIARLLETCQQPLFVLNRDRRTPRHRPIFSFEVTQPTAVEQREFWLQALSAQVPITSALSQQVNTLVSHFSLSPLAIQTICTRGLAGQAVITEETIRDRLWHACLSHARPQLEELAQPIHSQVTWNDLVVPDKEKQTLQAIVAQVRQRVKVYEHWGFGNQGQRGLGISVLFAGASGTGKTLAAEVLAHELKLDLYRIDLSSVVSKYIGETEKNLRRIFDAAEAGGAILLFDEADALFGKRSEVKDSHDRYANMEVAYLLQRMEAYRGLAILTTNLRSSIDQAFLRRLRFVVQFPFPDATQRAEIWQRVFPKLTPTENLSYTKLARLNIPGGNIRNIALNATFLAADADSPVQMHHILQAVQSEYAKLERPLTDAEIKGWDCSFPGRQS